MIVFFIGDVVGKPGREAINVLLPGIRNKYKVDFFIANGENSAGGSGITPSIAEELFSSGIHAITSGDHIWKKKEIFRMLDSEVRIFRPANYPVEVRGRGYGVLSTKKGVKVGIINLEGRVFMSPIECPFKYAEKAVAEILKETPVVIVDMHAEATSEKIALSWFLDGRVSAVLGTHTHIATADERILPRGTACITDVGMTGPYDSVIGRKQEQILERFLTNMPVRFEMAEGDVQLHGVVIDIDENTGKARSIKRVKEELK